MATALLLGTSAGAQLWDGDNYSFRTFSVAGRMGGQQAQGARHTVR